MSVRIKYLVTLVTAIEVGGFAKAARSLRITEGGVTHHIRALEKFFTTKLFTKSMRGLKLTEEGKVIYRFAKDVVDDVAQVRRQIMEMKQVLRGTIKIGASTIPGEHIVPQLINKFKEEHRGVDFIMQISNTEETLNQLMRREVDLAAVGSLRFVPKGLEFEKKVIGEEELVLIIPPKHELATREKISVQEILPLPFITRERGSGTRIETEEFLKKAGIDPSMLKIRLELGSTGSVITAVSEGGGVSIVSETAARKIEKAGLIKIVQICEADNRRTLYLIRNRQDEPSKPAKRFWEEIC